jgi:hypothetical protein
VRRKTALLEEERPLRCEKKDRFAEIEKTALLKEERPLR